MLLHKNYIYDIIVKKYFLKEDMLMPGKSAQSHDVYIETSYDAVYNADRNSKEFKGNQTAVKYALDDSYSSIPTYY